MTAGGLKFKPEGRELDSELTPALALTRARVRRNHESDSASGLTWTRDSEAADPTVAQSHDSDDSMIA